MRRARLLLILDFHFRKQAYEEESMTRYRELLYASYRATGYEAANPEGLSDNLIESYRADLGSLLPSDKKARIVDLGCGSGFLVQFLIRDGYKNVLGVDVSKEQVEFAKGLGLPVAQSNAFEFLKENKNFDLIISTDVLEHLNKNEIVEFLSAICDALNPSGSVIIRTVNASSVYGMTLLYWDFTHEVAFTEKSLRQVLLACGFEKVWIYDTKALFGLRPKRFLRWFLLKIWRLVLMCIFTLEVGVDRPRLFGKFLVAQAYKPLRGGK